MPRANLNKERIFAAAAELANQNGFAALSLKDIAAHFAVKPPSLFKHVRDLAEVRDALAVSGLARLRDAIAAIEEADAKKRLHRILHAYRGFAKSFPGEYDAFQETHVRRSPQVNQLGEEVLATFIAALPAKQSLTEKIHNLRFLRSALHGFIVLEKGRGFGLPEDVGESFNRMVDALISIVWGE